MKEMQLQRHSSLVDTWRWSKPQCSHQQTKSRNPSRPKQLRPANSRQAEQSSSSCYNCIVSAYYCLVLAAMTAAAAASKSILDQTVALGLCCSSPEGWSSQLLDVHSIFMISCVLHTVHHTVLSSVLTGAHQGSRRDVATERVLQAHSTRGSQ